MSMNIVGHPESLVLRSATDLTAKRLPKSNLFSLQSFGLATPEACKNISPGYAFFAYPGKTFPGENRTPEVVRGLDLSQERTTLGSIHRYCV